MSVTNIESLSLLHTPRLTLRLFENEKDAAFTALLMGPPFTAENLEKLTAGTCLPRSFLNGHTVPGSGIHIVHLGSSQGPQIGAIALRHRKWGFAPDIGWSVMPEHQGHGYAKEAAKEALRYWHEEIGIKEIRALMNYDNIQSYKVAKHIGLVEKGCVMYEGRDGSVLEVRALGFEEMKECTPETLIKGWGKLEVETDA